MAKTNVCEKCSRAFGSRRGLEQHDRKAHPYVPTPPPKRTTEQAPLEVWETKLLGARKQLGLGDVFWHVRKCVITKITTTEGSNDIEITAHVTKRHYSTDPV
ncbi:MAG: hypothetical protein AAB403_03600 [Planctomycetota bacterium]